MKPVVTRLYAVLVALTILGLLAWSGADWYQRQQQALAHGQAVLRQTAGLISNLSIRQTSLSQEVLNTVFARTTGVEGRWKMVLLSSPNRGTEYYKGPRPPIPVDQAVPRWQPRELSEVKVGLPVFLAQGDPLRLEGIYDFYGRAEVFSLLKASGMTLVTLVVLTALLVFWGSQRRESDPVPSEAPPPEPEGSWDGFDPGPLDLPAESLETVGTLPLEPNDEYWFDENLGLDDLPPLDALPALEELPPLGEDQELTFEEVQDHEPSLFSPATGMGWESFLKTRLDHELQRCSSQNQDLSLVLLAVKDGTVGSAAWGQAVREAFPSVDLDFEYGGGAAVVLPGRSLEQALKMARTFVESADRNLGDAVVHAGVAARSGRLLVAETLLGEADSAKRRSLAGTVRVLGLKTDPDRYREHLAGGASA